MSPAQPSSSPYALRPRRPKGRALAAMLMVGAGLLLQLAAPAAQAAPPPRRIISLAPAYTEAVCMLGACERLVGVDRFSDWPAQVRALPHLGSLDDVPLEALLRLQPDLVLAAPGGRLVPRLREAGITVLTPPSDSLEDIRQMMHTLALRLLQDDRVAQRWWQQVQAELSRARQRLDLNAAGRPRPLVYIEVDEALYAAGPTAYLGQVLEALGAGNIVPASLGAFPRLAPEFILRAQPALIMQMHTGAPLPRRPGWQRLQALQQGRLCQWPTDQVDVLVRPGPRLDQTIALMAACLERLR